MKTVPMRVAAIRSFLERHRTELRLSVRITVAALLAFLLSRLLVLPQGFWAVITAIVVVQASVGGSLKAALHRLIGTIGGAVYAAAVATLAHRLGSGPVLALLVALAPLALLAAFRQSFRVAPVTAAVVLLSPTGQAVAPALFALERVFEIAVGSATGLLASLLVLPARAHGLLTDAAARVLALQAKMVPLLLKGLEGTRDPAALQRLHDRIRAAMAALEDLGGEAKRERASHLTDEPDPGPLLRTLRRVRHDLVMIGRACAEPLPEPAASRLAPPLDALGRATTAFLGATGAALAQRTASPISLDALEPALEGYRAAMATLRQERLLHDLPEEAVGRAYGLAFGFEQLARDFDDLASRVRELAEPAQEHTRPADRAPPSSPLT